MRRRSAAMSRVDTPAVFTPQCPDQANAHARPKQRLHAWCSRHTTIAHLAPPPGAAALEFTAHAGLAWRTKILLIKALQLCTGTVPCVEDVLDRGQELLAG